ncbi:BTB/POZ protein [Flagelloscypha sp. PMI_526]|nr:BTB/POZ protein [Flagelloscypha sp. PMI_526]
MATDVTVDENEWVRITSNDGFSYLVKRKVATASGTFKSSLEAEMMESKNKTCPCTERSLIVEKLLEYMSFKTHYEGVGLKESVPLDDMMSRLHPEIVLELLLAADYHEV